MMKIIQHFGDTARVERAIEAIRWHLDYGWDAEFGGLLLARDVEGREPWWPFAETKLWWPHVEAMIALLMAYAHSGEQWCLDWHTRVHDYAFSHFPVAEHGEWTQRLTRQGTRLDTYVALPVKDPFHLPRALIHCLNTLKQIRQTERENSLHAEQM